MTHRVYVQWPNQRVSDKTVTESESVARFAFEELKNRSDLKVEGARGVAWTKDSGKVDYYEFSRRKLDQKER